MIKAVLFDLDGTLINTNHLIIESFKHTLKEYADIFLEEREIVQFFGEPLGTTFGRFDPENTELLCKIYRSFNESKHDELAEAIEGALDTVKELTAMGLKLGIVTSKRKELAKRGLRLFHLLDWMDVIISPEDTEKHKPEAEPALKACEMLGVAPEEAIMVGDSQFDILCGKNAGTKTCAVTYTAIPFEQLSVHQPTYIIDSLKELIQIVKK